MYCRMIPWLGALMALAACAPSGLRPFERALAANDSATAALEQWCAARALGNPAAITAALIRAPTDPVPSPQVRHLLGVEPGEAVGYRHVRLSCGGKVLSVAHNWYVPARLTPGMNRTLDSSDVPFGKVVAPLGFKRERLERKRGRDPACPRGTVLSHRGVLKLPDNRPISMVIECYTAANLGGGAG